MEALTDYNDHSPGILDLLRVMLLIALFGLMTCLESSAQVPTKTCCNPLHQLDVQKIRQFLAYLDSIEYWVKEGYQKGQIDSSEMDEARIILEKHLFSPSQCVINRMCPPDPVNMTAGYFQHYFLLKKSLSRNNRIFS